MYFCDVKSNVDRKDMLLWLEYVCVKPPFWKMWERPHPLAGSHNLRQVECVSFSVIELAREFSELFGQGVYTTEDPHII
jgi:hypothetical protein